MQAIFDAYYSLRIADDHFLYTRGLPFFDEALGYRAVFAALAGAPAQATEELDRAERELTEYDFTTVRTELEAFLTGDWEPVLEGLAKFKLNKPAKDGGGFFVMQKAVHLSRRADDLKSAFALLDGVRLTAADFPWLEDIRLLAQSEAAHRFGSKNEERTHGNAFLERQPLLFEPNHVFRFGFLEYQETLKARTNYVRH